LKKKNSPDCETIRTEYYKPVKILRNFCKMTHGALYKHRAIV
jgi:hypothetical protein